MDSINESDEEGESPPISSRHTFPGTGSERSPQLSPPHRPPSVATSDAESDQYDSEPESSPRIEAAALGAAADVADGCMTDQWL